MKKRKVFNYRRALESLRSFDFIDEEGELIRSVKPTIGFEEKDGYYIDRIDLLSDYKKRKIRTYFEELRAATQGGYYYPFKPRKKENLKLAKIYSGQNLSLNQMQVAFVPARFKEKPSLKFKRGEIKISEGGLRKTFVAFDNKALVLNPSKEIKRAIEKHAPKSFIFSIMAGRYEMIGGHYSPTDRNEIIKNVIELQNKYNDKKSGHYWENWLNGLQAYQFKTHEESMDYFTSQENVIKRIKAENKKKREDLKRKKYQQK